MTPAPYPFLPPHFPLLRTPTPGTPHCPPSLPASKRKKRKCKSALQTLNSCRNCSCYIIHPESFTEDSSSQTSNTTGYACARNQHVWIQNQISKIFIYYPSVRCAVSLQMNDVSWLYWYRAPTHKAKYQHRFGPTFKLIKEASKINKSFE